MAPGLTAVHEAGHHVLLHLFRQAEYAPELAEWRDAISRTQKFIFDTIVRDEMQAAGAVPEALKEIKRSLKWNELFARSYAQWVTVVGPSDRLRRQLKIRWRNQWDDADFEPLLEVFDRLFKRNSP